MMESVGMILAVILYGVAVLFCTKRSLHLLQEEFVREISGLESRYKSLILKKDEITKIKNTLREELSKILTLYEITKDITKKFHLKDAFAVFLEKLNQHIILRSCRLAGVDDLEINKTQEKDNQDVFALRSEKKAIGYLVVEGLRPHDRDKFIILAQQFALTLRRIQLYEEVEQIALTDSLTECYNRRYFMERLNQEIARAKLKKLKMSLLMIDVDHFKKINDEFGHLAGDEILRAVSEIIKSNIREIDIAARYGGEEFCLFLPDTDKDGAYLAAERICTAISAKPIRAYDALFNVTISIGAAVFPNNAVDGKSLIEVADRALYKAKESGRNRVELA